MSRTIFQTKNKRRRTRRGLMVFLVLLLVVALTAGIAFLVQSLFRSDNTPEDPPPPPIVEDEEADPLPDPVRQLPADFITRNTQAPRILLYDTSAKTVLYSKNANDKCAPASLTKLMTALVALEYAEPDTLITVGDELYLLDPESSRAGIHIGHQMTVTQALQGLLLQSGNDAAYALAAQIGHKMDESLTGKAAIDLFCQKMTEKAKALGCTNTTFRNPDGIDAEGHLTTANDLLKISLAAMEEPLIAQIMATPSVTTIFASGQTKTWTNSNKLLQESSPYYYNGAIGMKTGTTDAAENCLISCATRDGRTILCILLGAEKESIRWSETIELLNLGFF